MFASCRIAKSLDLCAVCSISISSMASPVSRYDCMADYHEQVARLWRQSSAITANHMMPYKFSASGRISTAHVARSGGDRDEQGGRLCALCVRVCVCTFRRTCVRVHMSACVCVSVRAERLCEPVGMRSFGFGVHSYPLRILVFRAACLTVEFAHTSPTNQRLITCVFAFMYASVPDDHGRY